MHSPRTLGSAGSDARPRRRSETQLELIHSTKHVQKIEELALAGGGAIDPDTYVGELTYRAALHAAGGACEMARALMSGEASLGFCGVRPSGHHAEPDRAMGFCFFNNIAIAAELAIAELGAERVFVLDWDVHHGNGTAEAFRRRSDVCSRASMNPGSILTAVRSATWDPVLARATRSTCPFPPAPKSSCGCRCSSTSCSPSPESSSPISC